MQELNKHVKSINHLLERYGVRFGIYKDGVFKEQLFPFDPIPRVIGKEEWDEIEAGLIQRVTALNLFLSDIYGEKKIVKDGVIPPEFIFSSSGYLTACEGLKTPKMSYHLVFTGSPGTGKTTVARIVARIYKDLGILKSGHMVETDRSGLVAEYMGQTAVKTNAICDSALNGVLFIDEAYALVPKNDNGGDYGQEAISTLLKRMEDDRDKLVVIIAGYPDEMKRFINSNPGLQSRFNRYINFPDYTPEELTKIFMMYVRKNQYTLSDEAKDYLMERLVDIVAKKDRYFGNARYVRNVFEKSIQHQANRLSKSSSAKTEEELKEITLSDLKATI